MKKLATVLTACFAFVSFNDAYSQAKLIEHVKHSDESLVIPYTKYVLPNGLTVLIHEDHSDPLVHVDVTYHVGSAREEVGKSGFAHFFEHMMFQGSDNVADEAHFKIITEAGGTLNGTTNRDRTNYFETVPKNQLEKMLWLEADRMGFLLDAVTQQKFEVQRATVKNERGQNYDNVPYGLVYENTSKVLYPYGHPYSWMTIGYIEDLDRVDVNDLKNFFLRWYGPNNAVLTIGGDVNPKEVITMVEKYFGSIPRGPEVKNMNSKIPSLSKDRKVTMVDQYAKIPMLRIVYPAPKLYTKEEAALDCLAEIIGQGNNSLLYQNLVKPRKAIQASAYNFASELAGEFTITVLPYPGGSLAEMEKEVQKVFEAFEKRGVSQAEVDKFKAKIESQTIYDLESVSGKVSKLASFYTFTGNPNFIQTYLKNYTSITPEDVMNAYNKYIKGKGAVILSVMTKDDTLNMVGDDKYVASPEGYIEPDYGYDGLKYNKAKDNFDRSIMPKSSGAITINAPEFWQEKVGATKYIGTQLDEIPVVNIMLNFKGGSMVESPDKAGVANLFANMMDEDTKLKTAEEFQNALDNLGSSISVSSNNESVTVFVRTLKKNLTPTLNLLEERLLQPAFKAETFDRLKAQKIEQYKNNLNKPSNVASNVINKLLFEGTPYDIPVSGTETTLNNITLKDVELYHTKHFSKNEAEVVIVGDVEKDEILKQLKFIDKMAGNKVVFPTISVENKAPKVQKQNIYFINFPGAAQTEFRIAKANNLKYDATGDYYKSGIMNFPLGGAFNSRLNLHLREVRGWTYGSRSSFIANKHIGYYIFSSGIKGDATDTALFEILQMVENYKINGPKPDELQFTQNAKIQSEAREYETGFHKARYLSNIIKYDLDKNFSKTQNKILKNIKIDEVRALSNQYIPSTREFVILLVGDKDNINSEMMNQFNIIELDKEGNMVN